MAKTIANLKNRKTPYIFSGVCKKYSQKEPWDVHLTITTPNVEAARELVESATKDLRYPAVSSLLPTRYVKEVDKKARAAFLKLKKNYKELTYIETLPELVVWLKTSKVLDKCLTKQKTP